MKRLCLIMAVILLISLFAGCGGNGQTNTPSDGNASAAGQASAPPKATDAPDPGTGSEQTPPVGGSETVNVPEENEPYRTAKGKYAVDSNGIANERYEYELPLTDSDITLTSWTTVWFPQFLGDPDYNNNEFIVEQENRSGVHIEYNIVSQAEMALNFAVLLASNELMDLMCDVDAYYPTTPLDAIQDDYFINILDYQEYCPNYLYVVNKMFPEDSRLHDTVYLNSNNILGFWSIMDQAVPAATNQVRTDWLERIGLTVDDIRTVDDFTEMLAAFKSQIPTAEYPLVAFGSVLDTTHYFACYDFYTMVGEFPGAAVKNGKAEFQFRNDDAKSYVEMYRNFFEQGFVDPNWGTGDSWDFKDNVYANKTGVMSIAVDEISSYLPMIQDPNAAIHPLHKVLRNEGQVLHLGNDATHCFYGRTSISAACEHIPLAVTWCDWRYSASGSDFASWGIQGLTWDYNEQGERELTDFALNNPYGAPTSWCMTMWAMDRFADHGFCSVEVQYAFESAKPYFELVEWQVNEFPYDGLYEWPKGAMLTADQSSEFLSLCTDLNTYVSEMIPQFACGDIAMEQWDSFLETMESLNLSAGEAIYTEAYQNYLANR